MFSLFGKLVIKPGPFWKNHVPLYFALYFFIWFFAVITVTIIFSISFWFNIHPYSTPFLGLHFRSSNPMNGFTLFMYLPFYLRFMLLIYITAGILSFIPMVPVGLMQSKRFEEDE